MIKTAVTALAWLWLLPAHAADSRPWSTADLKTLLLRSDNHWASGTVLSFPNTTTFENATERWTTFDAPSYAGAISPASEDDVVKTVKLAKEYSIPFLATGGRHSFTTTLSELQSGLAIDLSLLDSFTIDSDAETVTVSAFTTIGDLQDPLYDAGFFIQSASASCPSFLGLTVGGGIGRFNGYLGLEIDALISARIVTADGEILTISETENSELFWGVRGAGFNFGILVSATYKLHKLADNNDGQLLSADFIFPPDKTADYFDLLASFSGTMPANVAAINLYQFNSTTDEGQVLANWVYVGPEDEGREFLSPILDLKPAAATFSYIAWNKLLATAAGGENTLLCEKGAARSVYWAQLLNYSASTFQETFEKMDSLWATYPTLTSTSINLEIFPNQAATKVADNATAYPWRDAIGWIQFALLSSDGVGSDSFNAGDKIGRALRDTWAQNSGYDNLTIYVNYARGDEGLESIYGTDKLPRLAALKKQYDPDNVFGWNNPLPTQYP